jgi:sulfur carrier protein
MIQRILATVLGLALLAVVFIFTSILLAIGLSAALLLGAWMWWRDRGRIPRRGRSELSSAAMIQVTVNGKAHRFERPVEVAALLSTLNLVGKKVAVERNGEIVPRSAHASTVLADGDQLEIVVAVGGG